MMTPAPAPAPLAPTTAPPAPTTAPAAPRDSTVGAVVGAEAPSAAVELDYGQLLYRTYQAVLGGVTLHFWATSDLVDVCLPGCEVEACALSIALSDISSVEACAWSALISCAESLSGEPSAPD